jgi:hypothetical protein
MSTTQISKLGAVFIVVHPILQHGICPYLKKTFGDHSIDSLCGIMTTTASVAPIVLGSSSIAISAYQTDKVAFLNKIFPVWVNKLLPASLALFVVQGVVKGNDIPTKPSAIGLTKSVLELLAASAVCEYSEATTQVAKLAIAMFTTSAINSLFYMSMEGSFENHNKAANYALGFAVARPLYQIAQSDETPKFLASALYFAAPVARGAVLGVIGLGSVVVPGSNTGVISNMIDGISISLGALASQLAGPVLPSGLFLATNIAYKNKDDIAKLLGINATSVSDEPSTPKISGGVEHVKASDEL